MVYEKYIIVFKDKKQKAFYKKDDFSPNILKENEEYREVKFNPETTECFLDLNNNIILSNLENNTIVRNSLNNQNYFKNIFEGVRCEKSLILFLSLTDEGILNQIGFSENEIKIIKNIALEKIQKEYFALQL